MKSGPVTNQVGLSGTGAFDGDVLLGIIAEVGPRDAHIVPVTTIARLWPDVLSQVLRDNSPYRGMLPFEEEDAPNFFGREAQADDLHGRVRDEGAVLVVGGSGVGKSSLVRAGLVPRIREADECEIVMVRPGLKPFHSLAVAALELAGDISRGPDRVNSLAVEIKNRGVRNYFSEWASARRDRVLLVVDQLEEVFTVGDPTEVNRFVESLVAVDHEGSCAAVVATIRVDFFAELLAIPGADRAVQDRTMMLSPMDSESLKSAIVKPAGRQQVDFESGLVDRIVEDAEASRGALPLLQFALAELWDRQRGGLLAHESYDAIGGVRGAMEKYADSVVDRLGVRDGGLDRVRAILGRLVEMREDGKATRRSAPIAEFSDLLVGPTRDRMKALLEQLIISRLLVTGTDSAGRETVEIAHEAMIDSWRRLAQWLAEDRDLLRWRTRMQFYLDEGVLLPEGQVPEAVRWVDERPGEVSAPVRRLVEESRQKRDLVHDLTIREIHFRVKNSLQTIASLLRLQSRRLQSDETRLALMESVRRISSIALVHETLSQDSSRMVSFDKLAERLLDMLVHGLTDPKRPVAGQVHGSAGELYTEVATPLALVVSELVQNAIEHAFPDRDGSIQVTFDRRVGSLHVLVDDDGVGVPEDWSMEQAAHLGLQIALTLVESELGGTLTVDRRVDAGTRAEILMPLPR